MHPAYLGYHTLKEINLPPGGTNCEPVEEKACQMATFQQNIHTYYADLLKFDSKSYKTPVASVDPSMD